MSTKMLVYLAALLSTSGSVDEIPIDFVNNRPVVEAKIGDRKFRLLIDTGSPWTCLNGEAYKLLPKAASRLEVKIGGQKLQLGIRKLDGPALRDAASDPQERADGILGLDFLTHFSVGLDFPHKGIALWRPEATTFAAEKAWVTERSPGQSTATAGNLSKAPMGMSSTACVQGKDLQSVIDTGSAASFLDVPVMYDLGPLKFLPFRGFNGVYVSSDASPTFAPDYFSVAGAEVHTVHYMIMVDLQMPGIHMIVGSDAFQAVRAVLDFPRKSILVENFNNSEAKPPAPSPWDPDQGPPPYGALIIVRQAQFVAKIGSIYDYVESSDMDPAIVAGVHANLKIVTLPSGMKRVAIIARDRQ